MLHALYDAFPPSLIGVLLATGAVFWVSLAIYLGGHLLGLFINEEGESDEI